MVTLGTRHPMRQQHITNYVRHTSVQLAMPTDHRGLQRGGLSATDADVLHTLAAGRGISRYEEIGLVEECGNCGLWFASSVLRAHIPACVRD